MIESREIEFIPDRLNEEPVVFLSMTNSEIKFSALVFFALWSPIAIAIGLQVGKLLVSLALAPALVFVSMWLAGKRLRVVKRGKPKQHHMLALRAWLQDHGFIKEVFIRQSRVWDIKRWRTRQDPERRG